MPFEAARTRLAIGERLRRQRSRAAARPPLATAHDAFARIGARAWATRAARELEAAGSSAPSDPSEWDADLTTRERDVCQLGVRSRTELAARRWR